MEYNELFLLKDSDAPKKNDREIIIPLRLTGCVHGSIFTVEFIDETAYIIRKYCEGNESKWRCWCEL